MEFAIDELPDKYFRSTSSKLARSKTRSKKKRKMSIKDKNDSKRRSNDKRSFWCIFTINVLNLALLASLFAIYLYRKYTILEESYCPNYFYGSQCMRNDFIDSTFWSSENGYIAVDGECNEGYSFRTWAPGAHQVRLFFKNVEDDTFSFYPMIQQDGGFWFVILCSIFPGAQYKYLVDYQSSQDGYSLSLGGVERTSLSQDISNILTDDNHIVNSTKHIPLPSRPFIYQIHVPSYYLLDLDPLNTVRLRLPTLKLLGVNVVELNGIEFLNCVENKETCWRDSSYAPGLLRPTLGSLQEWVTLINDIHSFNMSVVIDLNWEVFNKNSLFWSYHKHFEKYTKSMNTSVLNDQSISDVFRDMQNCGFDQCPLDLSKNSLNNLVLYSVLHRYRHLYKVDGIRWIVNSCDQFIGGDCSNTNTMNVDNEYNNNTNDNLRIQQTAIVNNFWQMVRQLGFAIITSNKNSVPDYDYYIDTSICPIMNMVKASTKLGNIIYSILDKAKSAKTNDLITFECFDSLQTRLFTRSNYRMSSIILSLFYLLPSNIHFFMGTPYMSDIPFTIEPNQLDIDAVGYYMNGGWYRPRQKYGKLKMSLTLNHIREEYCKEDCNLEVYVDDTENNMLVLRVGNAQNPLLVIINYGYTDFPLENRYVFKVSSSIHPFYQRSSWELLFTTSNNEYDTQMTTITDNLVLSECKSNVDVKVNMCYNALIKYQSVNIYKPSPN